MFFHLNTGILKKLILLSAITLFVCLCSAFLPQNKEERHRFHLTGYAQGTTYQLTYYSVDERIEKTVIDSLLSSIDSTMSIYKSYSTINKFNTSDSGTRVDTGFRKVVEKSIQIFRETKGIFDITVAPLVAAWGFGTKTVETYPDSNQINALKSCVGTELIYLEGDFLHKRKPCVNIDVNGIAQGYSVDVLADYLLQQGIDCFVVEIGGELRIQGKKPDGSAMHIGIEGPAIDNDEPLIRHIVAIDKGAITTSGNYRKFKQNGAKRITHLIDPRTGYPLDNELISVTLFAEDAITADGYDNAIMAMHINDALKFIDKHPSLEAYIVYHDGDGQIVDTMSHGFKKLLIK